MRVVFLGRKPGSVDALEFLLKKNIEVVCVVCRQDVKNLYWEKTLFRAAQKKNIPVFSDNDLYKAISGEEVKGLNLSSVDLVISYLFWKKIKPPLIKLGKIGCINFHPAPLPDFRGVGGYNFAILEGLSNWGVSAHFVDNEFDTGDIIKVMRFQINPNDHTAFSLEQESQQHLLFLFKEVINLVLSGKPLPREKQGQGRYITKSEFESMRKISPHDSLETINKKIRAFWYPPFSGAYIEINGQQFTLANDFVLGNCSKSYHERE